MSPLLHLEVTITNAVYGLSGRDVVGSQVCLDDIDEDGDGCDGPERRRSDVEPSGELGCSGAEMRMSIHQSGNECLPL